MNIPDGAPDPDSKKCGWRPLPRYVAPDRAGAATAAHRFQPEPRDDHGQRHQPEPPPSNATALQHYASSAVHRHPRKPVGLRRGELPKHSARAVVPSSQHGSSLPYRGHPLQE